MLRWPVSLQPRLMRGWCRGLGGREPGVPGLSTPGRRLPRGRPPFFRVKMTRSVSWGCHDYHKRSDSTPAVCALTVPESEVQNHAASRASPLPPLNGRVLPASCWLPAPGSRWLLAFLGWWPHHSHLCPCSRRGALSPLGYSLSVCLNSPRGFSYLESSPARHWI